MWCKGASLTGKLNNLADENTPNPADSLPENSIHALAQGSIVLLTPAKLAWRSLLSVWPELLGKSKTELELPARLKP